MGFKFHPPCGSRVQSTRGSVVKKLSSFGVDQVGRSFSRLEALQIPVLLIHPECACDTSQRPARQSFEHLGGARFSRVGQVSLGRLDLRAADLASLRLSGPLMGTGFRGHCDFDLFLSFVATPLFSPGVVGAERVSRGLVSDNTDAKSQTHSKPRSYGRSSRVPLFRPHPARPDPPRESRRCLVLGHDASPDVTLKDQREVPIAFPVVAVVFIASTAMDVLLMLGSDV